MSSQVVTTKKGRGAGAAAGQGQPKPDLKLRIYTMLEFVRKFGMQISKALDKLTL